MVKAQVLYSGRYVNADSLGVVQQGATIGFQVTQEISGVALWRTVWGAEPVMEQWFASERRNAAIETAVSMILDGRQALAGAPQLRAAA